MNTINVIDQDTMDLRAQQDCRGSEDGSTYCNFVVRNGRPVYPHEIGSWIKLPPNGWKRRKKKPINKETFGLTLLKVQPNAS